MTASIQLPEYICTKRVWALKIGSVEPGLGRSDGDGSTGQPPRLIPADARYAPIEVTGAYISKHVPEAGGYWVRYKDGYESFSPAKAFEEGYVRHEPNAEDPAGEIEPDIHPCCGAPASFNHFATCASWTPPKPGSLSPVAVEPNQEPPKDVVLCSCGLAATNEDWKHHGSGCPARGSAPGQYVVADRDGPRCTEAPTGTRHNASGDCCNPVDDSEKDWMDPKDVPSGDPGYAMNRAGEEETKAVIGAIFGEPAPGSPAPGMRCKTCRWYSERGYEGTPPSKILMETGRCRRRSPETNGHPVVYPDDHKLDEGKI